MSDILKLVKAVNEKCQSKDGSVDHRYWAFRSVELLPELIAEIERLRSECRELKKTDVWANDVVKEHESLRGQIAAKEARIKELEASWMEMAKAIARPPGSPAYLIRRAKEDREWLVAYIERLEAAFLESEAAAHYYEECLILGQSDDGPAFFGWPGRKYQAFSDKEEMERHLMASREALDRIKEGGRDE